MGRSTLDIISESDPSALTVYRAEGTAAAQSNLRRYRTFKDLCEHVEAIVCSDWWSDRFPDAPIEVTVERRSRNATFSAAHISDDAALLLIVDGKHWKADFVLHELAHVASEGAGHGPVFLAALVALWRHEAGFPASVCLLKAFADAGLVVAGH